MLGIHDYWLFVVSAVLLNITPGQDMVAVTAVKLCGGAYLIYLGARLLCARHSLAATDDPHAEAARRGLVAAARLRTFLVGNPNAHTLIDRAAGGLFMLRGARLAWTR
jgi:threonine/homoserine/homoserine lactone efflux protein